MSSWIKRLTTKKGFKSRVFGRNGWFVIRKGD
nr:MAG TPA: hypothetical protein [Caudoviricetes sp.]